MDADGELCDDSVIQTFLEKLNLSDVVTSTAGLLSRVDLSHGQRKCLVLLQMHCEDRQILLLDEWAADQDPIFKDIFYKEILPAMKKSGKTIIVVSHDEKYFDCAEKILKLDEGQLMESQQTGTVMKR